MLMRRFGTLAILILGGLWLLAGPAAADNWPRFRGPNGTGVATGQQLPVKWAKDNVLWKVPVPGDGNSSPVIWGNRLFLQSARGDGERLLLCLDVNDGKTLWSRSVPGAKAVRHPKNSYASSSPATDGERVYAAFWDGKDVLLRAYDLAGNLVWNRNLGSFDSQHGAGASPIVYRDKVFYVLDQDVENGGKSMAVALDSKTGVPVWAQPRPGYRACYGAPFLWERAGATELVVVSTNEATGYNPDTGIVHWRWQWKHTHKIPLRVVGSPVFLGDMVIGTAGEGGQGRGLVTLKISGSEKDARAQLVWQNKKDFPYVPTILAYKGLLFFANDRGTAGCYQVENGNRLWLQQISESPFTSSPVIVDDKIYAADENGDVYVLAATPAFTLLARNELGERVRASLAVANNRLFVRGQFHLFCIGTPSSK